MKDSQRKAMFAKMKNKSFRQIRQKGFYLKYQGDADRDGVPNIKDCRPLDPKKQGILHEWQIKRLKKEEERVEREREKALKKLEDVKDELKIKQSISQKKLSIRQARQKKRQAIIDEVNAEKEKLRKVREANEQAKKELDKYTFTGKARSLLKKGGEKAAATSKAAIEKTNAFLNKKSTKDTIKRIGKKLNKLFS